MSAQGVSLYGNFALGAAGDFEYEAYYGISNINPELSFSQDIFSTIADSVADNILKHHPMFQDSSVLGTVPDPRVRNARNDMKHSEGIALVWNTPLEGFRLGATRMMGKTEQSAT